MRAQGIAYDEKRQVLYIAREAYPIAVYIMHIDSTFTDFTNSPPSHRARSALLPLTRLTPPYPDDEDWRYWLRDISDLHYDQESDTLLVLSDESNTIIQVNVTSGVVIDALRFSHKLDQPEALVMLPGGHEIFVFGENNEFSLLSLSFLAFK